MCFPKKRPHVPQKPAERSPEHKLFPPPIQKCNPIPPKAENTVHQKVGDVHKKLDNKDGSPPSSSPKKINNDTANTQEQPSSQSLESNHRNSRETHQQQHSKESNKPYSPNRRQDGGTDHLEPSTHQPLVPCASSYSISNDSKDLSKQMKEAASSPDQLKKQTQASAYATSHDDNSRDSNSSKTEQLSKESAFHAPDNGRQEPKASKNIKDQTDSSWSSSSPSKMNNPYKEQERSRLQSPQISSTHDEEIATLFPSLSHAESFTSY